jgi:aminoglycoside phosphotransferase (APT) family kinase protein
MAEARRGRRDAILARFGIDRSRRIGHGGEATVYALDDARVLRLYHASPHGIAQLAAFYDELAGQDPGFALPRIIEHGEIDGVPYTVDRRISGRSLMDALPALRGGERRRALDGYFEVACRVRELRTGRVPYGEILREDAVRAVSWPAYLHARMGRCLADSAGWLPADVSALDRAVERLRIGIDALAETAPLLVHGDVFPGNVMVGDDLRVTGLVDFGRLTCVGDPMMDVASSIVFLEVARGFHEDDVPYLTQLARERFGKSIFATIALYRAWYAVRFSPHRDDDTNLYAWCVRSLSEMAAP